jgi:hypothetical protein
MSRDLDGASSGIGLDALPEPARIAWARLRDDLRAILGDDLVAIWAYGGTIAPGPRPRAADLDTYVIVARRPEVTTVERVKAALAAIEDEHDVEWDEWVVPAGAAARHEPPTDVVNRSRPDASWAINRAQWLAGRYVAVFGPSPSSIVLPPQWSDIEAELELELEHLESHVADGDTDPFEATYALLNGCRILRGIEAHDVAISKAAAGAWGIARLPERWHAALDAAARVYVGDPAPDDAELLAKEMAPFVGMVRSRLSGPE